MTDHTTRRAAPLQIHSTVFAVLFAVGFCHALNDMMQSLLQAIYPNLKATFDLDFAHVGLVQAVFQVTASFLQPLVGAYTDKRAVPFALPAGMIATFFGLIGLALAPSYPLLLAAAALVGIGSSTFHPESSRVAYLAAGSRRGLAQSMFQVGGSIGSALGPLLAALAIAPGQRDALKAMLLRMSIRKPSPAQSPSVTMLLWILPAVPRGKKSVPPLTAALFVKVLSLMSKVRPSKIAPP